jgi:short-subunit dehydrogenase
MHLTHATDRGGVAVRPDYFSHRSAVITGAGSGIGRALAVTLATCGTRLALWDNDDEALATTAELCRTTSAAAVVRADRVDVTDADAVTEHAVAVRDAFGTVHLAFCLAGVIHTGSVLSSRTDDLDHVLNVNLRGTVNTATALLPHLVASSNGHLVTASSAFGLVAVPRYSAYCASKFAIRGFTDALRMELEAARAPVRVTCVVPGGVRTDIVRNGRFAGDEDAATVTARFDAHLARTTPEQAAITILRGVQHGKRQVLVGPDARAVAALARLTGNTYQRLLPRLARRAASHRTRTIT